MQATPNFSKDVEQLFTTIYLRDTESLALKFLKSTKIKITTYHRNITYCRSHQNKTKQNKRKKKKKKKTVQTVR